MTTPSSKSAKNSDPASVFAFSEEDEEPATEKGGKKAKTSTGDAAAKSKLFCSLALMLSCNV